MLGSVCAGWGGGGGVGVGVEAGGLEEFYYIVLQFSHSTELAVMTISVARVICL